MTMKHPMKLVPDANMPASVIALVSAGERLFQSEVRGATIISHLNPRAVVRVIVNELQLDK